MLSATQGKNRRNWAYKNYNKINSLRKKVLYSLTRKKINLNGLDGFQFIQHEMQRETEIYWKLVQNSCGAFVGGAICFKSVCELC